MCSSVVVYIESTYIIQICLSVWVDMFYVCLFYGNSGMSGLCVVMLGVVGGGLIVVCKCGSVCKQIKVIVDLSLPSKFLELRYF